MYTMGSMIFVMSVARVTVIRLQETPKFLLGQGKDAEVVSNLKSLATKYNRRCSITLEQFEAHGVVHTAHAKRAFSFGELWIHVRNLFSSRTVAYTTVLIWLSWSMIGLAYPLFNVFLPYYLSSRGVSFGVTSTYETWRNYALVQVCGIFGPILGGYMSNIRILGRRYTMVIGALITSESLWLEFLPPPPSLFSSEVPKLMHSCSGLLLRLFPGRKPSSERRLQLHDIFHTGDILCRSLWLHGGGATIRSPCYGEWDSGCLLPIHGCHVCRHRD